MDSRTDDINSYQFFLMTDVEASTALMHREQEAMHLALAEMEFIVRECALQHNGRVVKGRGEGDSLFLVFLRALDATQCAIEIQLQMENHDWPTSVPIKVRIGIDSGIAKERDEDLYGPEINRCARIRSACSGGQILAAEAIYLHCKSQFTQDVHWLNLGRHFLKDIPDAINLFRLVSPKFENIFTPIRTISAVPNNLTTHATPFFLRPNEQALVESSMRTVDRRLTTIVGFTGVGKSRLAIQSARACQDLYPDGIWFVALEDACEPAEVPGKILGSCGYDFGVELPSIETVIDHLREAKCLLVMDNCEHLVEDVAPIVETLLRKCSAIEILATSQCPIEIDGEQVVPIRGLDDEQTSNDASDAARFFVERVKSINIGWEPSIDELACVERICRSVDGIPVALELIASQVVMPVTTLFDIERGITDIFATAERRTRGIPTRHRTIQAVAEWSYQILSSSEQAMTRVLAELSAPASATAIAACASGHFKHRSEIETNLRSLFLRALIHRDKVGDEPRYKLLEIVKRYVLNLAERNHEGESIRLMHLRYFAQVAESADDLMELSPSKACQMFQLEYPNIRQALYFGLSESPVPADRLTPIVQLTGSLGRYLYAFGDNNLLSLLGSSVVKALETQPDSTSVAKALNTCGILMLRMGDFREAIAVFDRVRRIWSTESNSIRVAAALSNLGLCHIQSGDIQKSIEANLEALEIRVQNGNDLLVAISYNNLGMAHAAKGEYALAKEYYQQCASIRERHDDPIGCAAVWTNLAVVERELGAPIEAVKLVDRAIQVFSASGATHHLAVALYNRADTMLELRDWVECEHSIADSIATYESLNDATGILECKLLTAKMFFETGRFEESKTICADALKQPELAVELEIVAITLLHLVDSTAYPPPNLGQYPEHVVTACRKDLALLHRARRLIESWDP